MKKFALIALLLLVTFSLSAEVFFSANDLEPEKITEKRDFDGVIIAGTSDKHVTIETMSDAYDAPDGESFNNRIKLEGSGNTERRNVQFDALKGETLTLYIHSSGKDVRSLALVNADTKAEVTVFAAPVKDDPIGIVEFEIPADGTYVLYSKKSGINIYCIICE